MRLVRSVGVWLVWGIVGPFEMFVSLPAVVTVLTMHSLSKTGATWTAGKPLLRHYHDSGSPLRFWLEVVVGSIYYHFYIE